MRSHFIAGWGSWKSRRIPRFLSKARSGWSYCCRLAPAVLTAAGLSAAAGDGGAAFFAGGVTAGVAAGVWAGGPAWAVGACGGAWPRMMISTRRFMPRPSAVRLVATGRYSAYLAALRRSGLNPSRTMRRRTISVALEVESSQFEGNWAVWMGALSVWPSIRKR